MPCGGTSGRRRCPRPSRGYARAAPKAKAAGAQSKQPKVQESTDARTTH